MNLPHYTEDKHCQDSLSARVSEVAYSIGTVERDKDLVSAESHSELWDIELEDHVSALHPAENLSAASGQNGDGTVVMDTRALWASAYPNSGAMVTIADGQEKQCSVHAVKPQTVSLLGSEFAQLERNQPSSLCPSESASLYGQPHAAHKPEALDHRDTSIYFADTRKLTEAHIHLPAKPDGNIGYPPSDDLKTLGKPARINGTPDSMSIISRPVPNHINDSGMASPTPSMDSIAIELQEYERANFTWRNPITNGATKLLDMHNETGYTVNDGSHDWNATEYDGSLEDCYEYSDQQLGPEAYEVAGCSRTVYGDLYDFEAYENEMVQEAIDLECDPNCGLEYGSDHGFESASENYGDYLEVAEYDTSTGGYDEVDDGTVLIPQRFSQGREILLGLLQPDGIPQELLKPVPTVLHAEADVAKNLKEHWLPQKL